MKKFLAVITFSVLLFSTFAGINASAETVRFDSANPKTAAEFSKILDEKFAAKNLELRKRDLVLMASNPDLNKNRIVEFAWAVNIKSLGKNIDISKLNELESLPKRIINEIDTAKKSAEQIFPNYRDFKFVLYSSPYKMNKRIGFLSSAEIDIENIRKIIPELVLMQEGVKPEDIQKEELSKFDYRLFNY